VLVFVLYQEPSAKHATDEHDRGPVRFRTILAFENFILLMVVIFGLHFVDRSFGPVLPLYLEQLGTPLARVPLTAGLLFSIVAATGALGNRLCGSLLQRSTPRRIIVTCGGVGAACALLYAVAPASVWAFVITPIFGATMGIATTAAYTAAGAVMPARARATGFGFMSTASLTGVALSPIASGLLAATSIRAVFLLDSVGLVVLAILVSRLMIVAHAGKASAPVAEEM
jgi:MFS family permease